MRFVLVLTSMSLTFAFASGAHAQPGNQVPNTLDPGATQPVYQPPQPPAPPQQQPIVINVPGADGKTPTGTAEEDTGFYHQDEGLVDRMGRRNTALSAGPVPEIHVVRRGDTLWDIGTFYFNNPWEWPRIWSYNPTITNPHWIYPGDLVRLYRKGVGPITATAKLEAEPVARAGVVRRGFALRQLAFLDAKALESPMFVDGAVTAREMLVEGDGVYLRYGEKKPKVDANYSVYQEVEKIYDPANKKKLLGAYVKVMGEVRVASRKKNKRARATVVSSPYPIERGLKVGPRLETFKNIKTVANEVELQARVVSELRKLELIGDRQLVLIDAGENKGIKVGNRLYVIRRGDARVRRRGAGEAIGQNNPDFPARSVGEIIIADTGKDLSLGLVTVSEREIGVGDLVLMRKAKN